MSIVLVINRFLVEWKEVADQIQIEEGRVRLGESGEFTVSLWVFSVTVQRAVITRN